MTVSDVAGLAAVAGLALGALGWTLGAVASCGRGGIRMLAAVVFCFFVTLASVDLAFVLTQVAWSWFGGAVVDELRQWLAPAVAFVALPNGGWQNLGVLPTAPLAKAAIEATIGSAVLLAGRGLLSEETVAGHSGFTYIPRDFRHLGEAVLGRLEGGAGCIMLLTIPVTLPLIVGASIGILMFVSAHVAMAFVFAGLGRLSRGACVWADISAGRFRPPRPICPEPACIDAALPPAYACPICGALHDGLVPAPHGYVQRTCSCGASLPTLESFGRYRLVAHCGSCRRSLLTVSALHVLVAGPRAARTVGPFVEAVSRREVQGVERGTATVRASPDIWYASLRVQFGRTRDPLRIHLYAPCSDASGRDIELAEHRIVSACDAVMFCVSDPESTRRAPGGDDDKVRFDRVVNALAREQGSARTRRLTLRLAVLVPEPGPPERPWAVPPRNEWERTGAASSVAMSEPLARRLPALRAGIETHFREHRSFRAAASTPTSVGAALVWLAAPISTGRQVRRAASLRALAARATALLALAALLVPPTLAAVVLAKRMIPLMQEVMRPTLIPLVPDAEDE